MTTPSDVTVPYALANDSILHDTLHVRDGKSGDDRIRPVRKLLATMAPLLAVLIAVLALVAAVRSAAAQAVEPRSRGPIYRRIAADPNFAQNYNRWRNQYRTFDWSTDNCSGPSGLTGYADDFRWPCVQHDFAYRNNRRVGLHNEGTRRYADDLLRQHTRAICSRRTGLDRDNCYRASNVFYGAVRQFGGGSW